jgi:L-amino acid N-acyltransferase YncA
MTGLSVRDATEADIEAILDVYESVAAEDRWIGGELPVDRERHRSGRLERISGEDHLLAVAEVDGSIVAELGVYVAHGRGDLGMEIMEGFREQGIGSAMMERAIALYEKFGFEQEGYHPKQWLRRSGESWDTISMGLLL